MRVLITRPREDAAPLAARLAERGIDCLIEPLLHIRFLPGDPLDLDGLQGLLVTSANGVRAFAARQADRAIAVYAVGDASAAAARAAGFDQVHSAGGDVDSLADLVAERLDPGRGALLHIAGSAVAGDLAGRLDAAGFAYRRAVLYAAETATALSPEAAAALRRQRIDGVLMFSPRTARTFAGLLAGDDLAPVCAGMEGYCLSAAVRDAVAHLPWRRLRVAARPERDSLLALIDPAFDSAKGPDS